MGLDRLTENPIILYDRDRILRGGDSLAKYFYDMIQSVQDQIYRTNYYINRLPFFHPFSGGDSCDLTHPFVLDFKIPSKMTRIVSVKLSFHLRAFRSYATAAASGGGATSSSGGGATVTSANGGGATVTSADGGGATVTRANGGGATASSAAGGGETVTSANGGNQTSSSSGAFAGATTTDLALDDGNTSTVDGSVGNHFHTVAEYGVGGHYHSVTLAAHSHTVADHTHGVTIANHQHNVTLADHTHGVTVAAHTHSVTVADHTHSVTVAAHTHTVPAHVHGLDFGIYEEVNVPTVYYQVDDGSGYGAVSANYTSDQVDLDITSLVTTAGWKAIQFTPDVRCFISAIVITELNLSLTA